MSSEESIEYVILAKRECYAFAVPPATSASGYRAADWGNCIWKGRCQLIGKGAVLVIKLLENDGTLFLACPVRNDQPLESCVERTTDSSRYFVLKLTDANSGRKALMGFGFDERNDAFDFNVTIQDFRSQNVQSTSTSSSSDLFALRSDAPRFTLPASLTRPETSTPLPAPSDDFFDFGDFQSAKPSVTKKAAQNSLNELDDLFK